jgi:tetratricopeptide (TPR) repeat protein
MTSTVRSIIAVAVGIALIPAMVANGADLPGAGKRWIDLRTPNFVIFSHAGERATRAIASDLEELHAVLGSFSALELSSPIPTYIYVFRSDRDFKPYKPLREGRPSSVSGYFAPRTHGNYIAIDGNARRDATGIVYHEYVHYFVANNLPGLPLWFEEGLAELYSSLRIRGNYVEFGFPDPYHLVLLRNSPLIPLHELLTADHHSELYNERDRKSMFYAESWTLVHYLLVGSDERRTQTPAFLDLVVAGAPPTEALTRAFDTDERGLERELRLYSQREIFGHLESPVSIDVDLPVTVRRMSHAEVLYRLGDLLFQQDESRPEARGYFEAAVEVDPRNGLSWSALGVDAEQHARWGDARSFHDRALKTSPEEFLVQYRAGVFLLERGQDIDGAVAALERATELESGFGPAWVELTTAYRASGKRGPDVIAAAETAHRLSPARDDITLDLLRLYLADDRRDAAIGLVEESFVGSPGYRARAWSSVVDNDLERTRRLLAEGHLDDAEQRLDLAQGMIANTGAPAAFLQRAESLRSDLELLRFGHRYDQAVELFDRGEHDAARAILVDLLGDLPRDRQAQAIESMLRVIDGHPNAAPGGTTTIPTGGITSNDINEFNRRMARHDLDGARALLYDLQLRALPEEYEWIDQRLAEIRVIESYNHFVEQYNLAVDQFNDGDFTAAIATLERLLAEQPDGYGAVDARDLLRDARAELDRE